MRSCTFIALAIAVALSGCSRHSDGKAGAKAPVVRFVPLVERDVTDYEYFTGRTAAVDDVQVRARVTGYLDKVNFKAGSEVKKDDVLFEIDPRPYKATLDRTLGQIALAEAKLNLANVEKARGLKIALTPGAISQGELDKNDAEQKSAEATLQAAKADAEAAQLNYKFTKVLAPVAGIVGRELVTVGNLVTQDNTLLTTIVSLDPIYVYFDVDENTMRKIHKLIAEGKMPSVKDGKKAVVGFGLTDEGKEYPHEGEIDFVNNQLSSSTGTLQVRGKIANPRGKNETRMFMPGNFIRVRVPVGPPHKSLLAPQSAIGTDQARKFVYVVDKENKVERRVIEVGARQADGLQVVIPTTMAVGKDEQPSIRAGERIVVTGLQRIQPGVTVDPKAAAEEPK